MTVFLNALWSTTSLKSPKELTLRGTLHRLHTVSKVSVLCTWMFKLPPLTCLVVQATQCHFLHPLPLHEDHINLIEAHQIFLTSGSLSTRLRLRSRLKQNNSRDARNVNVDTSRRSITISGVLGTSSEKHQTGCLHVEDCRLSLHVLERFCNLTLPAPAQVSQIDR